MLRSSALSASKAKTRRDLADAAVRLFLDKGYEATTVDDIAMLANVSRRTFFRYFASKDDLVTAFFRTDVQTAIDYLCARPLDEPLPVSVRAAMHAALQPIAQEPAKARRNFQLLASSPPLRSRWLEEERRNQRLFAEAFASRLGWPEGALRTHLVAGAVTMAVVTSLELWAEQRVVPNPITFLDEALDILAVPLMEATARQD